MTTWARDNGGTLQYPTPEEFRGIPNYETNEPACRKRGYMPLVGEAEPREGYEAVPHEWHKVEQSVTRIEPRQTIVEDWETDPETGERRKIGEHTEMVDTEITLDKSYIQVDAWVWSKIPDPIPPDTTDRDNAEKAIVAAIVALAKEYDALSELKDMDDITIPNLRELATAKGVADGVFDALVTKLTPYKWQLEAVNGTTWAQCWEGLKSRFAQWVRELEA